MTSSPLPCPAFSSRDSEDDDLHVLQEEYRTVFQNVQDALFYVDVERRDGDPAFTVLELNGVAEEKSGWSTDEVRGKRLRELFDRDAAASIERQFRQCMVEEGAVTFKQTIRGPRRTTRWNVQVAPVVIDGQIPRLVGSARDVTQHEHTEAELRRTQTTYQLLFDSSQDAIFIHDWDGRILDANQQACELFGYARHTLIGREIPDLIPAERHDLMRDRFASLREGELVHGEATYLREDGSTFWGELWAMPFEVEDESLIRATIRDVTERRRAQNRLRLQARALEASANAIVISDREGTIEWVNPAFTEVTGYTAAEVMGENVRILKSDQQDDAFYADLWETITSGSVWHGELVNRRKDGSLYWEEQTITPVTDDDGTVEHFIAIKQDITERKKAEAALREREARLRGLANSVPGVIFSLSVQTDTDGYDVGHVSGQAESILGLEPEPDGFFAQFLDHVPDTHRNEVLDRLDEATETGSRWSFDVPFDTPSDTTIWIRGIAEPHERNEDTVFYGVLLDVTQEKRMESQLRQSEKMQTVGTLAGGLAHDFNNILHSVRIYLELCEDELDDDHSVRDYVQRVDRGLNRAEKIVDRLLTFSRSGDEEATKERIDLEEIVRESLDLVAPSMPDCIEVITEFQDDCTTAGDPDQLHQVAVNLLKNGVEAMSECPPDASTVLDVRLREASVDADLAQRYLNLDPGRYVRLAISDTGSGMTAETKNRIFEPFYTTKGTDGTGLGLSVVHGIVRAHEGDILVYSDPGEGTTFNVYLPLDDSSETGTDSL